MANILHLLFEEKVDPFILSSLQTLMNKLAKKNHYSYLLTPEKISSDPRNIEITDHSSLAWKNELKLQQAKPLTGSLYHTEALSVLFNPLYEQADIIHIHSGIKSKISPLLFPFLTGKPLVWTMYEQPDYLTSASNYSGEDCKQGEALEFLARNIYEREEFAPVYTSNKLATTMQTISNKSSRVIYPCVDDQVFRPTNRADARNLLGLPSKATIVMIVGATDPTWMSEINAKNKANIFYVVLGNSFNFAETQINEQVLRIVNIDIAPQIRAAYYQAATVIINSTNSLIPVIEATFCEVPVICPEGNISEELISHGRTGFIINKSVTLMNNLSLILNDPHSKSVSKNLRMLISQQVSNELSVAGYHKLYSDLLGKGSTSLQITTLSNHTDKKDINNSFDSIVSKHEIDKLVHLESDMEWSKTLDELENRLKAFGDDKKQSGIYCDTACAYILRSISQSQDTDRLWMILDIWAKYRNLPTRCGDFAGDEQVAALEFCITLRDVLKKMLLATSFQFLLHLSGDQATRLLYIWRIIFLNTTSPLNLPDDIHDEWWEDYCTVAKRSEATPVNLILASMYEDPTEWNINLNFDLLLSAPLPPVVKVIITIWLTSIQYFNNTVTWQQKMLANSVNFLRAAIKYPNVITEGFFHVCVEHFGLHFWRAAYIGTNTIEALTALGDFVAYNMKKIAPQYAAINHNYSRSLKKQKNGKIRLGYISHHFYSHAVTHYMINRLIHYNRDKFEVYVFSLGAKRDHMTEIVRNNSDQFITIDDLKPNRNFSQAIIESNLDILIYTDIGMDPDTMKMGSMQLAPVQCALVGHGTSTGLPAVQYYISGDFESPEAQLQYREKLIRLPNLGAAQYPPPNLVQPYSRSNFELPEDAVIFVSCANGNKHGPDRDQLLVQILQAVPEAIIVLKPFLSMDGIDHKFTKRIEAAATAGGVNDRLIVYSPLARTQDLLGLLSVSDIQLDTYPYGGWTTNMEALFMGLPIVTQEGELARSRWGSHMLRALDIQTGIAYNEQEYVNAAILLAKDANLRKQISNKIKDKVMNTLFNGANAQAAYERELESIYRKHFRSVKVGNRHENSTH